MTVTIEISTEREAQLRHYAETRKLTIEQAIAEMTYHVLSIDSYVHLQKSDPDEWGRRFHEWAESHDRTTPLLSDEAISRDSIYPDRV